MRHYLPEISPACLTGAVLAIESITDAAALLNGPTGCKFYHGAIADRLLMRNDSLDPLPYSKEFYFGQARVPATYLDGHDYVFGSTEKLRRILPVVAAHGHKLIAVINTPGSALIGDDLGLFIDEARLDVPCVAIENPGFSGEMADGFEQALIRVIDHLSPPERKIESGSVNLLGISIYHKHWEGSVRELTRLLGLCGIRVNSVICAGVDVSSLSNLRSAEANVLIHSEYGAVVGSWIESRFGIKCFRHDTGAPIGFDSTREWVVGVLSLIHI